MNTHCTRTIAKDEVQLFLHTLVRLTSPADMNVCRALFSQELERLRSQVEGLESDLRAETQRREEAELHVEEKDAELAGALARLGEYERVICVLIGVACIYHIVANFWWC